MADQVSLPQATTQRELALERSQKMSRALADAARKARLTVRRDSFAAPRYSRSNRSARLFAIISALVVVVLPTLASAVYFGLIAADQYQVETQFAIHAGEPIPLDSVGALTGIPSVHQAQDALIVVDYIRSRAMVDKLDKEIDLRAIYSRPEADSISRLDPEAPIEAVVKYWNRRIYTTIDPASGIVTANFRAFRPEDSLKVGEAVLAACEDLINTITRRARQDAYLQAQEEMVRAERGVAQASERFRQVRDQEKVIDPQKSGEATNKMIAELKVDRIKLESELQVNSRSLSPTAPQMRLLQARLEAMNGQIASLEKTLTALNPTQNPTLSQSFLRFDKAKLDQEWAETYYKMIASLLERAKVDYERQQVYLESFVRPSLPQQAEFPRRAWNVFITALAATGAWFALVFTRSMLKG